MLSDPARRPDQQTPRACPVRSPTVPRRPPIQANASGRTQSGPRLAVAPTRRTWETRLTRHHTVGVGLIGSTVDETANLGRGEATAMVKRVRVTSTAAPGVLAQEIVPGSVRPCSTYRGELARHRVITADGADYLITTSDERRQGSAFVTAAYPVARGYLIMMRQPLCALES